MTRTIRQERYRDGGSIFLTDGMYSFVKDLAMGERPTKGKWLTGWPKRGGKLVEEGTPEHDVLVEMISLNNEQNTSSFEQLTLP